MLHNVGLEARVDGSDAPPAPQPKQSCGHPDSLDKHGRGVVVRVPPGLAGSRGPADTLDNGMALDQAARPPPPPPPCLLEKKREPNNAVSGIHAYTYTYTQGGSDFCSTLVRSDFDDAQRLYHLIVLISPVIHPPFPSRSPPIVVNNAHGLSN